MLIYKVILLYSYVHTATSMLNVTSLILIIGPIFDTDLIPLPWYKGSTGLALSSIYSHIPFYYMYISIDIQ